MLDPRNALSVYTKFGRQRMRKMKLVKPHKRGWRWTARHRDTRLLDMLYAMT